MCPLMSVSSLSVSAGVFGRTGCSTIGSLGLHVGVLLVHYCIRELPAAGMWCSAVQELLCGILA